LASVVEKRLRRRIKRTQMKKFDDELQGKCTGMAAYFWISIELSSMVVRTD
jgi:hypothetical protein